MIKTIFYKTIIVLIVITLTSFHEGGDGTIKINQDPSIEKLTEKHIAINEKHNTTNGYRIQIFSISGTNSKDRANLMKSEFLTKYPNNEVYIVYHAPTFKVRIGNYRTKLEALKFIQEIKINYPFAFVAVDKIEFIPN